MNYFIGIDGGGTKTRCVLTDNNLRIISQIEGPSSNPHVIGFDKSAQLIIDLIVEIRKSKEIKYCIAGIAGCGRKNHSDLLKKSIMQKVVSSDIYFPSFYIVSDAEITLGGAFIGKPGAILIAGTGSIIYGRDKNGIIYRAGGFGKIIGDEGSGYSIGKKGLTAAAKSFDKRKKNFALLKLLKSHCGIYNKEDLINMTYSNEIQISEIAPLVIDCAWAGDSVCKKIIYNEISELILHIKALMRQMNDEKINLCFGGGLLTEKNYYSVTLKSEIKKVFPEVKIKKSVYPPEIGAVILAKQHCLNR